MLEILSNGVPFMAGLSLINKFPIFILTCIQICSFSVFVVSMRFNSCSLFIYIIYLFLFYSVKTGLRVFGSFIRNRFHW